MDNPPILNEGWMPILDEDTTRHWSDKLVSRDLVHIGKIIHIVGLWRASFAGVHECQSTVPR